MRYDHSSGPPRLVLLGSVRLHSVDGHDITPCSVKARALLACLALSPGGKVTRAKIAGLLWSDGGDPKASLRRCVMELRETARKSGTEILSVDDESLALDLDRLWVDALNLESLAAGNASANPEAIVALYGGDLAEGLSLSNTDFEVWLRAERSRLREMACCAIGRTLSDDAADRGLRVRSARALLRIDPAHEESHRILMEQHAASGELEAAVRQYLDCRQALARRLDLSPSAETEALLARIRSGALRQGDARRDDPPPAGSIVAAPSRFRAIISLEQQRLTTEDGAISALLHGLREALSRKAWLAVVDRIPDDAQAVRMQPLEAAIYRISVGLFRSRDRMRVMVELGCAASGRLLWSEHHDRSLTDDTLVILDDLVPMLAHRLDREMELADMAGNSMPQIKAANASISPRERYRIARHGSGGTA